MKFTMEGPATSCHCGWKPPKSMTLMPTAILKMVAAPSVAKGGLGAFLEATLIACPVCGAEMRAGEARIVGT